jgi:peptidoglycan hydrolase CwlO-like protein
MRPFVMVVMLVAACGPSMRENARYPHHREHQEQRIDELEAHVGALEKQIVELQRQVATLQTAPAPVAPGS